MGSKQTIPLHFPAFAQGADGEGTPPLHKEAKVGRNVRRQLLLPKGSQDAGALGATLPPPMIYLSGGNP